MSNPFHAHSQTFTTMAQQQMNSGYGRKMQNRERIQEFTSSILKHGVKSDIVSEVEPGVFFSPSDKMKMEDLTTKLKQIDTKLAHYRNMKLRMQNLIKGMKKTRNLRDDVVKTVSANVFSMIPIDVLNNILENSCGEDEDIFAMIERIKSAKVEEKRNFIDIDVSDTEMSDTMNEDDQQLLNALEAKRKRKSGGKKRSAKKAKIETVSSLQSDLELSDDEQ
jgi:hypothetical protein